jgi:hypothetical protein
MMAAYITSFSNDFGEPESRVFDRHTRGGEDQDHGCLCKSQRREKRPRENGRYDSSTHTWAGFCVVVDGAINLLGTEAWGTGGGDGSSSDEIS